MRKFPILALFALAAFAAIPGVASASLTANGETLPNGTELVGKGNVEWHSPYGDCQFSQINAEITSNGAAPTLHIKSWTFKGLEANGACGWSILGAVEPTLNATNLCGIKGTSRWNVVAGSSCSASANPELTMYLVGYNWTCRYSGPFLANSYSTPFEFVPYFEQKAMSRTVGGEFCPGGVLLEPWMSFKTADGRTVNA